MCNFDILEKISIHFETPQRHISDWGLWVRSQQRRAIAPIQNRFGAFPPKNNQFYVDICALYRLGPFEDNPFSFCTVVMCIVMAVDTSGLSNAPFSLVALPLYVQAK